jgi:hypothetical protein
MRSTTRRSSSTKIFREVSFLAGGGSGEEED